uniref:Uncharacterized protein n=1 Tax=Opuntia streptacantha TaxID=393608 RepID=A0A7C9DES9_OPUST
MYTSLNASFFGGRMISLMATIFSWSIKRRSLISLSVLFASTMLSNELPIFLIATCWRVSEFTAAQTRPEAPRPMGRIGGTYLEETSNKLPWTLYCTYLPP